MDHAQDECCMFAMVIWQERRVRDDRRRKLGAGGPPILRSVSGEWGIRVERGEGGGFDGYQALREKTGTNRFYCIRVNTKVRGNAGGSRDRFRQGWRGWFEFLERKSAVPAAQAVQLRGREQHPFTGLRGLNAPAQRGAAASYQVRCGKRCRLVDAAEWQADPAQRRWCGVGCEGARRWMGRCNSFWNGVPGGSGQFGITAFTGAVSGLPCRVIAADV